VPGADIDHSRTTNAGIQLKEEALATGESQGFGFLKGGTCDGEGFPSRRHFSTARDALCDALTRQIAALALLRQKELFHRPCPNYAIGLCFHSDYKVARQFRGNLCKAYFYGVEEKARHPAELFLFRGTMSTPDWRCLECEGTSKPTHSHAL
jgi:hypothetical protein